jgi:hypothetical protein
MPLEANISTNCSTLTITGGTDYSNAQVDIYWNDVTITSVPRETVFPYNNITTLTSSGELSLSIANFIDSMGDPATTYSHFNGIFKIVVTVPAVGQGVDTVYELGAVGMCDINCCLGAKTKELIKCKCDECIECSSMLTDITKIYLLLNGAKINVAGCVQTTALYEKSIDEYLKAKEICGAKDCNCNC